MLKFKYSRKKLIFLFIKKSSFRFNKINLVRSFKKQNVNKYFPFPIIGIGKLNLNNFSNTLNSYHLYHQINYYFHLTIIVEGL